MSHMSSLGGCRRAARARGTAVVLALALLPLLLACGKKGDPRPPLRIIPNATRDLAVSQRGEQLVFRFGFPQTTTAGAKLPALAAIEVWELTRPLADPANLPI